MRLITRPPLRSSTVHVWYDGWLLSGERVQTQVLVVGAGPAGLLLAAELERRGVSCLLIDLLDAPQPWDRATVVHPRSIEIFEALGLVEPMLERGVSTRAARFRSQGEVLGEIDLTSSGSRYDFDLGVSEEVTESILTGHLHRQGGDVVRSSRLVDLARDDDGVAATVEHDGSRRRSAPTGSSGCDGLHSIARELAGIELAGHDIPTQWAVFDVTVDDWSDDYDVAAAYLETPPVILTPLPDRRWRVYLRPTSDDCDLAADAERVLPPTSRPLPSPTSRTRPASTATPGSRPRSAPVACCWPATPPTCARRRRGTA